MMRDNIYSITGKSFFAAAFLGLGILHIVTGRFADELFPVGRAAAANLFLVYLNGAALVVAGILIMTKKYTLQGAFLAAGIFALFLAFVHIPLLLSNLHANGDWTPTSESFMFFSGALMLAGSVLIELKHSPWGKRLFITGKYIFALTLFDFAMEHLISETEVITFIPAWIPWKTFWAYLVMCAFFAAFISILIRQLERLSSLLLFLMFFLWVCVLHIPDVASNAGSEFAWTNLFVPIGVCGVALFWRHQQWAPLKNRKH